jgi:hypothetical protein
MAWSRLGAHSEHAVERGDGADWLPGNLRKGRDEDLVPLIAGGLPRHLVTSHLDSAQTPGPNPSLATGRPSMAVPWTPKPTRTPSSVQTYWEGRASMEDLPTARSVGFAVWAGRPRTCDRAIHEPPALTD